MIKSPARSLALPMTALLVLAGCANTREGAQKDAEINAEKAREGAQELKADAQRGAEKAAEATSDAMQDVKEGAEKAAEATSEALDEAGQKAEAAGRTLEVKTALMADKRVDASRIDVDSVYAGKVIHLRGAVTTEAEKAMAETIAVEKSPGWKISNELTVSAK